MTDNTNKVNPITFGQGLEGEALDQLAVNVIRGLAMDAVQKADSGHPGMPMGAADMAYVLWTHFLTHNPLEPDWPDRDRFVLSAGHGSMLLYALLHLSGYAVTLDDIRNFRQWESITPGHPEHGLTPGVETTTGPLGQGFANGVGMALAEKILSGMFSGSDWNPVDHFTYAIVSDGDLMEGVSNEAASLAGHLGLGKLIYLYDDNCITIEGATGLCFQEDVAARFKALGWHVQRVDGHDRATAHKALNKARRVTDKPSLILARTHIAYGSPNKQDNASSHGAPLGEEEVRLTKEKLGLPPDEKFFVPDVVREHFAKRANYLKNKCNRWKRNFKKWQADNPEKAKLWDKLMTREIPEDLSNRLPTYKPGEKIATRNASGKALQTLAETLPGLIGGSADLAPSNQTIIKSSCSLCRDDFGGRNIHFGIREHAMGSIMNGMALHGGFIPYGGTFLVFCDYMRPAIRLAALMKLKVVYIFTHDSIFVGEDGPTHQPVEQIQALRAIPNLRVFRPSDASEVNVAWVEALRRDDGPTALLLTRQNLPVLDRSKLAPADGLKRGGYVLKRERSSPADLIILASGSEVSISLEAAGILEAEGKSVRVVAVPSIELFAEQPEDYRNEVLPPEVLCRVSVEAGRTACWKPYVGPFGEAVGVDNFGKSAPASVLAEKYGINTAHVVEVARKVINKFPEKMRNLKDKIKNY